MPVDAPDSLSGTTFAGRYHVQRRLGMGGMGAVYLATQDPLGRQVGLKVLRPSLIGDPVAVQRFRNEAKIIAQLAHPHIVGIHEFDTTPDGVLFISMEYLPGQSLGATLRATGALPWERTLPIVRGITQALSAAHRRGIVHRDLKPDNIILVEIEGMRDFVKVLDFGIAKLIAATENAPNLTGTGFVPGTPTYIAPEQIMDSGRDDVRSDLYSLGITWFEMLTGRRPFEGESAMKIFLAHLNEPPPKIAERRPDLAVPAEVEALMCSLLAKDPNARPKDAEALLAALDDVAACCLPAQRATQTPPASSPAPAASYDPGLATLSSSTPMVPRATSTPGTGSEQPTADTLAALRAEGRAWRKRWIGISAAMALLVGACALLFVVRTFRENDRWGELPLHDTNLAGTLGDAVQAYLDVDTPRAMAAVHRVLAADASEPGAIALQGLLTDEQAPDLRAALFGRARTALRMLDSTTHQGATIIKLLDDAYHVPPAELEQRWHACGHECDENLLALLAFGGLFGCDELAHEELSLELLDRAIALEPQHAGPYERKTTVLLRVGRYHEAVVAAHAGLKQSPDSPALLEAAGKAHLAAGEVNEAVAMFKQAVAKNAGASARLSLASAYILLDDENARVLAINGLMQDATPAQVCFVAATHGISLIGAGRGQSAYELLRTCAETRGATSEDTASAIMATAAAFDALEDTEVWQRVRALSERVVGDTGSAHFLKTIRQVGDAVAAAVEGDRATARTELDKIEQLHDELWPPRSRDGILDLVRVRVLAAEGKTDEALVVARRLDRPCRSHARAASINLGAGRITDAADDLEWLTDKASFCRQADFQGAFVLHGLILRAQMEAKTDAAGAAKRLGAALERLFPRLEDGAIKARADRLLSSAPPAGK